MRESANQIEEFSRRLTGSIFSKDIRLSDLSLPDLFPSDTDVNLGKDQTPQSKKSRRRLAPKNTIDLDSSPSSDDPRHVDGDRNRNLTDIFKGMGLDQAGPFEPAGPSGSAEPAPAPTTGVQPIASAAPGMEVGHPN